MRIVAFFFFLLSALALVWDLWRWGGRGPVYLADLGANWQALHAGSVQSARSLLGRYVSPTAWDSAVQPVLDVPAVLLFGALGLICLLIYAITARGRRR